MSRIRRTVSALLLTGTLAAAGLVGVSGQEPQSAVQSIPSLSEPGQGLAIRSRSAKDGLVTFATRSGDGLLLPGVAGTAAETRALAFADLYGEPFGLTSQADVRPMGRSRVDALGQEHVRLQQMRDGVPITAGELIVHLRGNRVVAANGRTLKDVAVQLTPSIAPAGALEQALTLIAKYRGDQAGDARFSSPRLEVFNRGMIDEGTFPTRLAWFIEASGEELRQYIWVDAHTGGILLTFSQLAEAKNRSVFDVALGSTLPGTLVRSEGSAPIGIADANQAYDFAGQTYDYFSINHNRDSFDNAGGQLRSSVRYRHPSAPGTPFQNAFWNGTQMVYGEGFASADDVVAHELSHAVTERSANLLYYNQSGALNESFSDIFGETMDLTNGVGNDGAGVRWQLGEDLSIGAIRHMMTPALFGDPGKLSDSGQFVCRSDAWTSDSADSGGVHSNSGVPNHGFALMVDGGTYNGRAITGIGLAKAAKVQYRALTTYLTSGSGFADNAQALNQSCSDLIGTLGITSADCAQVATALVAVEMANPWPCAGATPPPATFCPTGGAPTPVFVDGFESGGASWSPSSTSVNNWAIIGDFAKDGTRSVYGEDVGTLSDHRVAMTNAVVLPGAARLSFDHAFEFEHQGSTFYYDGGVLEFSTNGTTWSDAGSLIDGGQAYNGTLAAGNPLGTRAGFVRSSFGYTGTRLNLASLAGQAVRFRFRVGTDSSVGSLGWAVDNFRIYTCGSAPPPGSPEPPTGLSAASIAGNVVTLRWTPPATGATPTAYQLEGGVNPGEVLASIPTGSATPIYTFVAPTGAFHVRMHTISGASKSLASNEIRIFVNVPQPPSAPTNLLGTVNGDFIALAWKNTFAGGAPTNVVLDVSGALATTIPLGATDAFTFAGVPPGTYTISLRALNGAGASPSSNPITLTFPGACSGVPQAPANLLAYRVGSTIFVTWDPAASGPAPTAFILNVGGSFVGSFGTSGRALSGVVGPGSYVIDVVAANPCGNGPATAPVIVTVP